MRETAEQRSRTMRAVRSQDTAPEMTVRRFLHAAGLRYRLHDKGLPGKPDLVFPRRRVALFVHGCFWHQHPGCPAARRPATNTEYWTRKLDGNTARDARRVAELKSQGWIVITIWECETRDQAALDHLLELIQNMPVHRAAAAPRSVRGGSPRRDATIVADVRRV
ncbi:very short patch repair endonuclease [Nocardia nova]|uniref:very short patch repair endonuclease n=1 Tax=Nocardia nova TaxID=37330 RepID=UPI00189616A0|nr:very short patch repair endonuclease [Nocardia nova]MBF6150214.1 DNA mismatch endonuclease Vsr [Nocardia nova]